MTEYTEISADSPIKIDEKDRSLSEKVKQIGYDKIDLHTKVYPEKHVKEFIKDIMEGNKLELKGHSEGYKDGWSSAISFMMIKIKDRAGDKLI